jgi:hypothetical protein
VLHAVKIYFVICPKIKHYIMLFVLIHSKTNEMFPPKGGKTLKLSIFLLGTATEVLN